MSHPDANPSRHPGIDVVEAPISSLLLQVVRAFGQVGGRLLQRIGLVPPHELVLLELDERGGTCPQVELVRFLGRDRSTVTNTLQAMERAGLVTRAPSPTDGRAMLVAITEQGRAALPAVRATWAELEQLTTGALSPEQREQLADALSAVRANLAAALEADDVAAGDRHPPSPESKQ